MKLRPPFLLLGLTSAALAATPQTASPRATDQARQLDPATELAAARQDLAEMRKRFRDKHPAVVTQLQKIKQLEKTVGATQAEPAAATK